MKVTQWVDFSREIEVNVSGQEAADAIMGGSEDWTPEELVRKMCSNFITTLRAIPDTAIAAQTPGALKIIGNALEEQAERFRRLQEFPR